MVATMCYYGLSMNSVNLAGNTYVNFVLSAFIEIPSYIFCILVMDGWGRKPILVFTQILAGVTCIIAGLNIPDWLITTMTLLGRIEDHKAVKRKSRPSNRNFLFLDSAMRLF